ncbi:unnamed protein product [Angiostrongylus costaricensis]|uniref:Glucuronosyltransferase n=1 Tax=Angiostrongylus costaricensis TaxID=334426 RepID=A0A0R3Q1H9_ANGCS|nr:unnamed protein product [Angiostrongylus costaricensis]
MTSAHHLIRVQGGIPHLITNSGKICIEVKSTHGLPHVDGLLPPFIVPVNQFANVGPDKETWAKAICCRKPSVLVLKMKIPSEMDLKSFDLTRNLTSSLSELVRESILRVKRGKRSLPERFLREYLVKVHRIERIGNSMNVIFSPVQTDVDSKILENDLSSLDLNYLTRFLTFPVLSAVAPANTDSHLNFIVLGILSSLLSIAFLCILFRSILKDFAKTVRFHIYWIHFRKKKNGVLASADDGNGDGGDDCGGNGMAVSENDVDSVVDGDGEDVDGRTLLRSTRFTLHTLRTVSIES